MRDTEISPEVQSTTTDAAVPAEASEQGAVGTPPPHTGGTGSRRARHDIERSRHTRISGAWASVFVGVLLGVALIDFVVENTRSVRISFFSAGGRMPVAVALLAATLAGAAAVLVVGVCRTAQLRLSLHRHRRQSAVEPSPQVPAGVTDGGAQ